jgi:hypothetical protein
MINQIRQLKPWTTFLWIGKETSVGLFKKKDEVLEYVNAWTFLADHLLTHQKELFSIDVS